MSLLYNAEFANSAEISDNAAQSWALQAKHVAKNSDFYRGHWLGKAIPDRLEDLPSLPLCDKAQLRIAQVEQPPFGSYLAVPKSRATRLHRTSGTTGQAMNLALSTRDAHITAVVGGRCHRAAGLTADDTVVHCLNYRMWMGGLTDHMTLEETGALVVPFGVGDSELLIRTIRDVGVTAISCTPSYPAVLEQVIAERFQGLSPRDLGLRLGLFGGEPGLDDPAFRDRLQQVWGFQPRNANYGVSDVFCNFASECEHDTSLHFMAADVLHAELIDPESGEPKPLQSGQTGELVLTHLLRDCQPLVRFRTGDIITVNATEPCACGRTGFRFSVVGRSDDMIVVRGLNMFPTMVASVLNTVPDLSGEYRIVLETPPPHDSLPIDVELAAGVTPGPAFSDRVADALKTMLGATAHVTLCEHGMLPRTEGKTRRVIRTF